MIQRCFQRVKSGLLKNKFAALVTIMHTALQKKTNNNNPHKHEAIARCYRLCKILGNRGTFPKSALPARA